MQTGYYQRIQTIYGDMMIVVIHPHSMSRETAQHYAAHYTTLPEVTDDDVHRAPIRPASATLLDYLLRALRRPKKTLGR